MPFQIVLTRILIDGSILTALISVILVGMLYFNPRLALSDYPPDVQAAVPPRTRKEFQLGLLLSIPVLLIGLAVPFYSVWLVKQQSGGVLTYWMAFGTIFGEYFLMSLFDLIVLDIWLFYTWTPKFLVLPGTQGMAGYKNWRPHAKAQLLKGNAALTIVAAVLALIPAYFLLRAAQPWPAVDAAAPRANWPASFAGCRASTATRPSNAAPLRPIVGPPVHNCRT